MRIGIDMLAVQSPDSRLRGVGRYGRNLVESLLALGEGHDFVLYAHPGMTAEHVPESPNSTLRTLGDEAPRDAMNRLARENPDALDALLILNPFELHPGYEPPARPFRSLRMAAVVYDFIPFLDQEHYLADPGNAGRFYRRLHTISRYDRLLAISEATRADARRLLGLADDRVVNISGASDGAFFVPPTSFSPPRTARNVFHQLGIRRPFVFCVAGADERKNVRGLIDAFSRLTPSRKASHQLVVTCHLKPEDEARIRQIGRDLGVEASLVLTGQVSDGALLSLYQHCAMFAFPSLYEGLGLPLLEAMHCGAAVIAGNNSSQIEVVGDAGLLVNAAEPDEIARAIESLLADPERTRDLGRKAIARAAEFRWERSAQRTLSALTAPADRRRSIRVDRSPCPRPRLAVVSPWRPKKSGISTYSAWLVGELARHYRIDLYHDEGYVPDLGVSRDGFSTFDYRLFPRNAKARDYRAVLYQMGNSPYHGFMVDMMRAHPGIVTLHDFSLAGFQFWDAHRSADPREAFRRELLRCEGPRADAILANLDEWKREPGGVQDALTRRGIHMNRGILEAASRVIVHSPWCVSQLDDEMARKARVIPHGAWQVAPCAEHRRAARSRFGLDASATVFGSFGFLSRGKMNAEALRAFARVAAELPSAVFLFAGQDYESGEARREADSLGIGSRVRFLGHQSDDDFEALIACTDIGVSLRRPPTYGETSGALLNLLRHGLPCIVTDVGTFSDYPDAIVRKVRWPDDGLDGLTSAMRSLAIDRERRESMGRAAYAFVAENHAWPTVAGKYIEVIEDMAGRRADGIAAGTHARGPRNHREVVR